MQGPHPPRPWEMKGRATLSALWGEDTAGTDTGVVCTSSGPGCAGHSGTNSEEACLSVRPYLEGAGDRSGPAGPQRAAHSAPPRSMGHLQRALPTAPGAAWHSWPRPSAPGPSDPRAGPPLGQR